MRKVGRPENKKRNVKVVKLLREMQSITAVARKFRVSRQAIQAIAKRKGFTFRRFLTQGGK